SVGIDFDADQRSSEPLGNARNGTRVETCPVAAELIQQIHFAASAGAPVGRLLLRQHDVEVSDSTSIAVEIETPSAIGHVAGVGDLNHRVALAVVYDLREDQDGPLTFGVAGRMRRARKEHARSENASKADGARALDRPHEFLLLPITARAQ